MTGTGYGSSHSALVSLNHTNCCCAGEVVEKNQSTRLFGIFFMLTCCCLYCAAATNIFGVPQRKDISQSASETTRNNRSSVDMESLGEIIQSSGCTTSTGFNIESLILGILLKQKSTALHDDVMAIRQVSQTIAADVMQYVYKRWYHIWK